MTVEELHHDVLDLAVDSGVLAGVIDMDEARMAHRCRSARLGQEPLAGRWVVRVGRRQHLDRDLAVKPLVAGAVDAGHAAACQQLVDAVSARERPSDEGIAGVASVAHSAGGAPCRIVTSSARTRAVRDRTCASLRSGVAAMAPPPSLIAMTSATSASRASALSRATSAPAASTAAASLPSIASSRR